jgi:glycosyltransferase involved in cell wall biosynthesis
MRETLVSVVIPCYNQGRFVGEALESVFGQTYARVEVILVDDGSTDDLAAVLQPFAGRPELAVIRQENRGLSAARNRGLAEAQGSLVQFLDADDWLDPEKLARQVAVLAAHPEIGLVFSDYFLVYNNVDLCEQDTVADRCDDPFNPDLFLTWWIQGVFPPCAALVRKEWIRRAGGFNTKLQAYEDYEFWLRLSAHGCRASYLPDRLAYYRQHEGSMTAEADTRRLHAALQAARSELARQFPDKIGAAMDYLDAYYYRREMQLQEKLAALLAENARLALAIHPTDGGEARATCP